MGDARWISDAEASWKLSGAGAFCHEVGVIVLAWGLVRKDGLVSFVLKRVKMEEVDMFAEFCFGEVVADLNRA